MKLNVKKFMVMALSVLLSATCYAQFGSAFSANASSGTLEEAFVQFTGNSSVKVLRSSSQSMSDDEFWKWRRYEFSLPQKSKNMWLMQEIMDAYDREISQPDVDYSYLCELQPGQETSDWTAFSIPYSKKEKPFVVGGEPSFSLLVVRKNRNKPDMNVIYAMEWRQNSQRNLIQGNIYIVETAGELSKIDSKTDGLAQERYKTENIRRLSFYRDRFRSDPLRGGAISAGCVLIAKDLKAEGNKADIDEAKTILHEMLGMMKEPYSYSTDYALYKEVYDKLTAAIEILISASGN